MRWRWILPSLYLLVALIAWIDFVRTPPDGLANLGLMLIVFPVALVDLALRPAFKRTDSIFIPSSLGYYPAHAVFFGCSVLILAAALYLFGRAIDRLLARSK